MSSGADPAGRLRLASPTFGSDALPALEEVLASGRLTQGPKVEAFEEAVAAMCDTAHAVACTSATTALELTLAALGVGPGDEVVVADFTYPATANAVIQRGATPRLVDVDPGTWCAPAAAIEEALSDRTAAVITVDVFGLPADYPAIEPLLRERAVPLICDAACSLGGAVGDRACGGFGQASCFSFHPRKSLTTGEGGMVTTDDAGLADRLRLLRNHGARREGWRARFVEPGFNYRLGEMAAALGLTQTPRFGEVVRRRRELAAGLTARLAATGGAHPQAVPDGWQHPYQSYVVQLDESRDRDQVIEGLDALGIEATLGTYALHAEPAFAPICATEPGDLPVSHALAERTLALPLHDRLDERDLDRIAGGLDRALEGAGVPAGG